MRGREDVRWRREEEEERIRFGEEERRGVGVKRGEGEEYSGSVAQSCDRLAPFVGSRVRFPVAVLKPRGERL